MSLDGYIAALNDTPEQGLGEDGMRLLETVYGFRPDLPPRPELRVEFTIHPLRRGHRHEHTVLWEVEEPGPPPDGTVLPARRQPTQSATV